MLPAITTEDATEGLFKIAQRTPFNIAPERKEELASDILKGDIWTISREGGRANFSAVVYDRELVLRHSGLASLWCMTYVAFHIMDIASRRLRESKQNKNQNIDFSQEFNNLDLHKYLAYSKKLFDKDTLWPNDLYHPDINASLASRNGRINNIFFGALSWILLHEIGHVYYGDSLLVPVSNRIQQEYNADEFATKWVLDNAGNGLQREFRVLVISIALAWLFLLESNRGQSNTHPPTILRFREVEKHFMLLDRSSGLENCAYVLKAILDPKSSPPDFDNPKESFKWMANRLEKLYPCHR